MYSEAVNFFHSLLSSSKKRNKKKMVGHYSNPLIEFLEINYFESDVVSLLALIAAFVCVMFCLRVLLKWEMQVKDHMRVQWMKWVVPPGFPMDVCTGGC
jgi:hypothetical protein